MTIHVDYNISLSGITQGNIYIRRDLVNNLSSFNKASSFEDRIVIIVTCQ